jgi:hypothetical protein
MAGVVAPMQQTAELVWAEFVSGDLVLLLLLLLLTSLMSSQGCPVPVVAAVL